MSPEALARYKNPDNDRRGLWKSDPATAQSGHGTKDQFYILTGPGGKEHELQSGRCWLYTKAVMQEAIDDGRIWFGRTGNGVPRIKTYLNEAPGTLTPESILFARDAGTNESAKNSLKKLFDGVAVFETPKPVQLIELLIGLGGFEGIILDFFGGSGTTGHAVQLANLADNGSRTCILVQMAIPSSSETSSITENPFTTSLTSLIKERLRRAGAKIKAEHPLFQGDLGFRVLKLDTTSIRPWDPTLPVTEQRLLGEVDNILPDRTEQDLLYELLLKRGLELTVPIAERTLAGKQVFAVSTGDLIACLAPHIESADVEALAEGIVTWYKELAPPPAVNPNASLERPAKFDPPLVVFRDTAFADDVAKSNLTEILKQHSLTDVRSL